MATVKAFNFERKLARKSSGFLSVELVGGGELEVVQQWDWIGRNSRVAQWKRAGPITQRSVDRNHALLMFLLL